MGDSQPSDTIDDAGFGSSDGGLHAQAVKNGSTLVWYMMNRFQEIRVAQSQADFPSGTLTKLKPKP
jgi:hypothetical protein